MSLEAKLNIQFTKLSIFDLISELENCLLVFDDSCEEIFNDKEFPKLATARRHKKFSVIYVKHNFFSKVSGHELLILIQHTSFY